jgi:hypothetical protein
MSSNEPDPFTLAREFNRNTKWVSIGSHFFEVRGKDQKRIPPETPRATVKQWLLVRYWEAVTRRTVTETVKALRSITFIGRV